VDWFASGCTDTVLFIGLVRWGIRAQAEEIIQSVARVIAGTGYVTFEFPLPLMSLILMVKKTSMVRFHKRECTRTQSHCPHGTNRCHDKKDGNDDNFLCERIGLPLSLALTIERARSPLMKDAGRGG
jgi:hypothetical protein